MRLPDHFLGCSHIAVSRAAVLRFFNLLVQNFWYKVGPRTKKISAFFFCVQWGATVTVTVSRGL